MNKYLKLYAWVWKSFGEETFTLDEFRAVFPSPDPRKVIFDLKKSGYVKRVKRGQYRAVDPQDFFRDIVERSFEKEKILKRAEKKYAFTGSDAVRIWTEGYYWTGFTKGFKPVHIKVLEEDLDWWGGFFEENNTEYSLEGEDKTMFGLVFILHPQVGFEIESKNGTPVIPLEETVKFCKDNELVYQPALEYLSEEYDLDLVEKREHVPY